MIDGYRLDVCLRSETHAELYRAHELSSGSSCLIRILNLADDEREAFLRDAKIASGLFHPNLVDVYQVGTTVNGEVFVGSEDPDGRSLRDFIDGFGTPNLLTSVEIIRQAAEALHTLHLAGVTHRAVNPDNIVMSKDAHGEILVRLQDPDFGGVRQRSVVSNKFAIDGALGSLRYFAPEQCSSEEIDARTDVYGLGVVFYELLAGVPPFDGPSATALIHKQRNQSPPEIRIDNFDLRMLVTHCLTESLQKPLRLRQASADLFARQLRHIEQLATHSSTPPPAGTVNTQPSGTIFTPPFQPPRHIDAQPVTPAARVHVDVVEAAASLVEARIEQVSAPELPAIDPVQAEIEPVGQMAAAEPVVELPSAGNEARTPRRSRLKVSKKKLHTIAARLEVERSTREPLMVDAPVEIVVEPVISPPPVEEAPEILERAVELIEAHPPEVLPVKIEWEQAEDDIPSIEEVAAARIEDEIEAEESPAILVSPVEHVPVPDEVVEPAEEISPVVERTVTRLAETEIDQPQDMGLKAEVPSRLKRPIRKVKVWDLHDEEITLVRPPGRRMTVDIDRPFSPERKSRPVRRPAADTLAFYPTILGGSLDQPAAAVDERQDIFMTLDAPARELISSHRRSILLGCGFIALMSLILFGNDSLSRYFQGWSSADSVASTEPETSEPLPPTEALIAAPAKKKVVKSVDKPLKETAPASTKAKAVEEPKPRSTTSVRPARTATPEKTVVRSKPAVEDTKRKVEKKAAVAEKTGPATRPRIVKLPR
jgi:serine/threonine protein kinase